MDSWAQWLVLGAIVMAQLRDWMQFRHLEATAATTLSIYKELLASHEARIKNLEAKIRASDHR